MRTLHHFRRAPITLLLALVGTGLAAQAARGACLEGSVVIHYEQVPDQVLLDRTRCLVPTPFPGHPASIGLDEEQEEGLLPPGAPSGIAFRVWLPG